MYMRHGLKAVDLTERLKPADAGKDRPWRQSLQLVSSPGDQLDLVLYRNYKKREGTKAGRWDGRWGESAKQGWQAYLLISYDFYMRAVNDKREFAQGSRMDRAKKKNTLASALL